MDHPTRPTQTTSAEYTSGGILESGLRPATDLLEESFQKVANYFLSVPFVNFFVSFCFKTLFATCSLGKTHGNDIASGVFIFRAAGLQEI